MTSYDMLMTTHKIANKISSYCGPMHFAYVSISNLTQSYWDIDKAIMKLIRSKVQE